MRTLNANYTKNIQILKENLDRGLSAAQSANTIDNMERQFERAGLYDDEAQQFIATMRATVLDHFSGTISATEAMAQLGVHVVRVA
jgi:CII-binding regulator of phage lambda lysogenization HflD